MSEEQKVSRSRDHEPHICSVTSGQSRTPEGDYPFWVKELADEQANGLRLLAALKALLAVVADHPEFQGRKYDSLGIQVNSAIAKAEGRQ